MADYQWNPLTDEKKFEDLINDLCSKKYGIEFQIYGRKGQKQYGIDGSALTADKKHILHQCKNKMISRSDSAIQSELLKDLETETVSMLSEFIEKKDYILDKFIFANSFKRDTKLQDKATELSVTHDIVVSVWSWDEISDMLEEYTDIAQKYYPQSFNKTSNTKLSPQLTTKLGKSTLIGREKELQEIDEQLKASKTLLVKGIGGVGKSTIVSNYLHRHKDEYDYYGFFEGLESFETELEGTFKLEIEEGQDRFDRVFRELIRLDGNKLLVIDDVKEIKENQEKLEKILGLEHNGYRVLLTSREEIEDVEQYDLDILSMDDAKKLFNSIYNVEDEVLLEEILEYLDCHAFFIDKTAHSIKKTVTPDMIRNKFKNGEFSKIKRKRKESFNDYLNELFSFDELDDEEVLMLKQFSALPSVYINLENLEYFFQRKENSELEELLDFLSEKGWLIKLEDGYKLHQIIKEYIFVNHISSFEEIEVVLDTFLNIMGNTADVKIAIDNQNNIIYFESLVTLLDMLKTANKKVKVASFFSHFGNIYRYLAFYQKAEQLYLKGLKILQKTLGKEHLKIATSYNNLAGLYELMQKYQKSEEFYLKSLKIREKVLGDNHSRTASSYINLAGLYESMGEYEKAEQLYLKGLKIKENLLGKEHSSTATSYNNLALFYKLVGKCKKVKSLHLKALKIIKKILGDEHPNTASSYNNLAVFHYGQKDYKKAHDYVKMAIAIRLKVFPKEHPDLMSSKKWLEKIEKKL